MTTVAAAAVARFLLLFPMVVSYLSLVVSHLFE
jgi:hypothetical protein